MRRALFATELFAWCLERTGPFNLQAVLTLRGPLEAPAVERATAALRRRQPLLGVRFARPPGFEPTAAPLPLARRAAASRRERLRVAQREVNRSVVAGDAPLARVVWLDGGDEHDLVLTAHHAICDGRSLLGVMRRLAHDCARVVAGRTLDVEPLPPRPPLEERLGLEPPPSAAAERLAASGAVARVRAGETFTLRRHLEPAATAALRRACRRAGLDLTSVLLAALAQAGGGRSSLPELDCIATADMRAAGDAAEALGYEVSFLSAPCPIDAAAHPLRLAEAIRSRLREAAGRGEAVAALRRLAAAFAEAEPAALIDSFRVRRPTVAVSNLGVVDLPERVGSFEVRALRVATAASGFWSFRPSRLLIASTLGGRLQLELVAASTAQGRDELGRIADALLGRLAAATAAGAADGRLSRRT